ncbi:hemolysin-type calcium-binding region (plasmid) [Stanieria cyanosphaera PCC 7437]|uniref:Hemolysin-type calcium-binding region n=1 Tax=Stanieria cyanosphaera (strain ATCC 29371 / PCC 7437) TaxID=111780 RepID=K9Y0T6_STAC7|nr:vanadium-dependent haloperoxidase [Stanieria cyanosphaera]AFZ38001.1 hemolysin-type calcium-binding region [Stanieria cyanosphaera PCC 7437]
MESGEQFRPPTPEPFLLVDGRGGVQVSPFEGEVSPSRVNLDAKTITLADGSVLEVDRSLIGTIINPKFIKQAEEIIDYSANLTDRQKLIAEFWEDGRGTSFPPGTWMSFGEYVSDRDNHSLDQDAKMFFTLSNALFDTGIATWECKTYYDYTRPVAAIRQLGELGLIGEYNRDLGGYAIEAWQPGLGKTTILAKDFITYQTPNSHPSPPFAEYTSGHSAFSAAGAEILQLFTGSDEFGAKVTFDPGQSRFEPGLTPEKTVTLGWDTFSQAAREAGTSRLYGGIHFSDGNHYGSILGTEVAEAVFAQAQFYIND